jgi:hypothetical protein
VEGKNVLSFLWIWILAFILDIDQIAAIQPKRNSVKQMIGLAIAVIPTIYVINVNFLGLSNHVLQLGQYLQIQHDNFLEEY